MKSSYLEIEKVSINQREALKILKKVLPHEEIECILMARRVKLAYDKQENELAKDLHTQLIKSHPERGTTVYNLIGAGYFDEMIIPFIDIYKSQYEERYVEEYRKFYFSTIKFFPLAIFVGNGTSERQIIEGITDRLKLDAPFIRLHAIGGTNIKKIDDSMNILKIEDKYSVKDNRFTTPAGLQGQILEIRIGSHKK